MPKTFEQQLARVRAMPTDGRLWPADEEAISAVLAAYDRLAANLDACKNALTFVARYQTALDAVGLGVLSKSCQDTLEKLT